MSAMCTNAVPFQSCSLAYHVQSDSLTHMPRTMIYIFLQYLFLEENILAD